jgi:signal transduction histidine kinase
MPRPTRTELVVASVCGACAVGFYAPDGAPAVAAAALTGLVVLLYRRRPALAVLGVAAATALALAVGVSGENPGGLAAGLTVTFALGRYAGRRGLPALVALVAVLAAPSGPAVIDVVFVSVVLGATWACGRLVRRRADAAERSAAEAAELAAVDPEQLTARVIAEERARLAGEALAVVRRAVVSMREAAAGAEVTLDPGALTAVQEAGRTAVSDLRRLLGLLRTESEDAPAAGASGALPVAHRRRMRADLLAAAGLVLLCAVEAAAAGASVEWDELLLTAAFVGCVSLRRWEAALACLLAVVPVALAAALDAPLVMGFAATIAIGLLSWSAASDGRPRALGALIALAAVTVVVVASDEPDNGPALVALFALPAVAGQLFGARRREGEAAEATAVTLRAAQAEAAERAARGERLRLARELHDVASHAVGVMVLQAGAAAALRERDPDAAREAVRTLQRAGSEAVAELDALFGVLDAGAVGPPGHAAPAPPLEVSAALHALAERIRAAGLEVSLSVPGDVTPRGDVAATALRIVQEALTNALRHAAGSRVTVALHRDGGELVVEVRDDGGRAGRHEPGFGLVGLEERVRALGGEFAAGPREGGGFAVSARLPDRSPAATVVPA